MIYVAGIVGLVGGFVLGQMLLLFLLRHRTKEDLLNDKYLKWKYGTLNWLVAALGCYGTVEMYKMYFY